MLLSFNTTLSIIGLALVFLCSLGIVLLAGYILRLMRIQQQPPKSYSSLQLNAREFVKSLSSGIQPAHDKAQALPAPVLWSYVPPTELIPGPTLMPMRPQESLLYADRLAEQGTTGIAQNLPDKLAG